MSSSAFNSHTDLSKHESLPANVLHGRNTSAWQRTLMFQYWSYTLHYTIFNAALCAVTPLHLIWVMFNLHSCSQETLGLHGKQHNPVDAVTRREHVRYRHEEAAVRISCSGIPWTSTSVVIDRKECGGFTHGEAGGCCSSVTTGPRRPDAHRCDKRQTCTGTQTIMTSSWASTTRTNSFLKSSYTHPFSEAPK